MTLPASGTITSEQIREELGLAPGTPFTIPTDVRTLTGVSSGPIVWPNDFWGKFLRDFAQVDSGAAGGTFSFGAADTNRRIFVLAFHGGTASDPGAAPTCTIAGGSATRHAADTSGDGAGDASGVAIFAANPSGTSGNISVSWGGLPITVYVFRGIGYNHSSAHDTETDDPSTNLNIPADGLTIGGKGSPSSQSTTWTGLTERADPGTRSVAWNFNMSSQTGRSITVDPYTVGNFGYSMAVASFAKL